MDFTSHVHFVCVIVQELPVASHKLHSKLRGHCPEVVLEQGDLISCTVFTVKQWNEISGFVFIFNLFSDELTGED